MEGHVELRMVVLYKNWFAVFKNFGVLEWPSANTISIRNSRGF